MRQMAKRNLSKEEIIDEAIKLLRSDGLEGLSMRNLATRLNVRAPTLYYHIPDKNALLNEIMIKLFGECFARMPNCATWQQWMREFGKAIWDVQQEATFAPQLIFSTKLDDEHFEESLEMARRELAKFDVNQEQAFFIQSAVQAVVTGWTIFANSAYSEKMGRYFAFREAAMSSIDQLIDGFSKGSDLSKAFNGISPQAAGN